MMSIKVVETFIWAYMQKNMAKWDIPEKNIENAAQRRRPQVCRTLHSKVTAKNFFINKIPCILSCKAENIRRITCRQVADIAQSADVLKFYVQKESNRF